KLASPEAGVSETGGGSEQGTPRATASTVPRSAVVIRRIGGSLQATETAADSRKSRRCIPRPHSRKALLARGASHVPGAVAGSEPAGSWLDIFCGFEGDDRGGRAWGGASVLPKR